MTTKNKMKWLYAALLAGTLTLMGPPSPAVDDSVNDDNLFELGQNEDTLEDHDTTFGSGPHSGQRDPRANILGCTDADETGTVPADCTNPADTFSLKVTPGRGPDWADLFTGELNTDVDPTDIDRVFVVPTPKDVVSGTPGNITPGSDGIPDFKNYGGIFATFIGDQISAAGLDDETTTVSGGSDTNNDLPTTYEWNTDSVPIKDDLTNLGCYARNNPANNHLIIYCGVERLNTDGDSHLDLEINQSPVGLDEEPPCDKLHCFFTGVRTTNDVLVSVDFTNGGDLGSLDVRKWTTTTAPNGSWGDPLVELTGEGCNPAFGTTDADSVCIFNNNANINGGPWPNFVKSSTPVANDTAANGYTGGVIPRNALSEMGIDVTELLGQTPCFSTALVRTRSAQSFTAQLKDFAATGFALCGIAVTKTGDSLSKVTDPVNYTITIENTGGITLFKDDISDSLLGSITSNGVDQANAFVTSNTCAASLASGASCTISLTRTVQAGDPDPLPNVVTVTYNNQVNLSGAAVTETDDHSVNLFQPAVTVDKTADKTLAAVGENVKYTFTITNTSSSDAPNLLVDSINDTVLGDLSGPAPASCDNLAFGASCTFDVNRVVLAGDPDPLVNTVTVHYHPLNFPNDIHASDSHSVNLFTTGVVVTKGGDTLSKIGDSAHFTYHIVNTGSADSPSLILDSVIDDKVGTLTAAATTAGCGTLAPGAFCDFSADRVTQAGDPDPLVNTVTVHFHPTGLATDVADTDNHSTNLFQPSVDVTKVCNEPDKTVVAGDVADFLITIHNTSSADSPNLVLDNFTDTLGTSAAAGCSTLAPGASCQFSASKLTSTGDTAVTNTATAHYHPAGFPNDISDSGSDTCAVVPPAKAEIHIEKVTLGSTGSFNYTTGGGDGLVDFSLTTVLGASDPTSPFGVPPATDGFATIETDVDTIFGTSRTYTVDEVVPAGFEFVSLQCTESDVQDSTPLVIDTASHLATLKVEPGETLYCRYVNKPVQVGQGCTPGYWRNHATRWDGSSGATINASGPVNCGGSNANDFTTDVKTCRLFDATFGVSSVQSGVAITQTLLGATQSPGLTQLRQLAFQAAAALASADAGQAPNDVLDYPYTIQQVIDIYRDGVGADPGPLNVQDAKNLLAAANNLGCPLN